MAGSVGGHVSEWWVQASCPWVSSLGKNVSLSGCPPTHEQTCLYSKGPYTPVVCWGWVGVCKCGDSFPAHGRRKDVE